MGLHRADESLAGGQRDVQADSRGAGSRDDYSVFTRARGNFFSSRICGAVAEGRDVHRGVVQSPSMLDQHRRRG